MQSREIHMMGTIIQLSVQHKYADFVLDELIIQLKEYEQRFSAHDPTSELMKVNKNAGIKPVKVHPNLYELIKIGKKHSTAAGSSLNIAIGPLVQAWRIGFADAHVPSEDNIQSLLRKTSASDIILDDQEQTVFLKNIGMFIDLGALAKGFIADLLIHDLESMNVQAGLINLGGNVMTYGNSPKHEDGYWRVGIQHPSLSRGHYIAILKAFNQSVVTSGIYERKFTTNDKTYHHILDPHTGYPIQSEIAGLTIVSKKSVDGEIWTGRLFGQSPDRIIETLNQVKDVAGIVVTNNGELYYSESLGPYLMESK
ncbi:FAD:protein FMN transferase [Bacillus sp. J14TS2]|uniref:FAD:protein FMN transferase n=1 Tax=Bacillus sp. J14TS2 TaxID=2807188 RepID=UPI001B09B1BE|nr:FAD:protein FMN transferase [Bacillus sp. J14TS2]GIN72370.1 FAD:protein FMN transferase [Bacillus sp. J14TS2]